MKQITVIPAIEKEKEASAGQSGKKRAAVYARVSTDKEEQSGSYEMQIEYYTKLITEDAGMELVGVYADEGVSGTSTKYRKGFRVMMEDALNGKIDRIYTKSISRFARNTVDSLVSIRQLKDAGCEVYFEKENIFTFDAKGELLITIMSSIAQEESRSLSENVTWGTRRRFADGKYSLRCKSFLGYEKTPDGVRINEKEASVVRRIYYMFLAGNTPYKIAKILQSENIPTPMGKTMWHNSVVKSILQNEKYAGNALLQKTYSVSFLTKKRQCNDGQLPQYFIENGHPAIVSQKLFDEVQARFAALSSLPPEDAGGLRCGCCGSKYCRVVWHQGSTGEKVMWRCGKKYVKGCRTPYLSDETVAGLFDAARRALLGDKKLLLRSLRALKTPSARMRAQKKEIEEIRKYLSAEFNPLCAARVQKLERELACERERNDLIARLPDAAPEEVLAALPGDRIQCEPVRRIVVTEHRRACAFFSFGEALLPLAIIR